jgi:hypothetical protein
LRRIVAAMMAVALQGMFYELLVPRATIHVPSPPIPRLEVMLLRISRSVSAVKRRGVSEAQRSRSQVSSRREKNASAARAAFPRRFVQSQGNSARGARIDWARALRNEVRTVESRAEAPPEVSFSFPKAPTPAPAVPKFGWYYAGTHRIEELAGGGTIINLTDRCAIVVYVLPIPVCRIGRIPANGDLFEHLHDRPDCMLRVGSRKHDDGCRDIAQRIE